MTKEILPTAIFLNKRKNIFESTAPFFNATDGKACDFNTYFTLSADNHYFKIDFRCEDNFYVDENTLQNHNEPLYNQEVFEVFIGVGSQDSYTYWEIEINPNNALWIGKISNPSLGNNLQTLIQQYTPEQSGIGHKVETSGNAWWGSLMIPWKFIGKSDDNAYRINFYRIRSRYPHLDPNWVCDTETCDFVCWQSTYSGNEPAFHKPKRFGYLNIEGSMANHDILV